MPSSEAIYKLATARAELAEVVACDQKSFGKERLSSEKNAAVETTEADATTPSWFGRTVSDTTFIREQLAADYWCPLDFTSHEVSLDQRKTGD